MIPKTLSNDLQIRTIAPPAAGQAEWTVTNARHLRLRVTSAGTKTFTMRYRFNGKLRNRALGRFPDLSLAGARRKCEIANGVLANGGDPFPEPAATRVEALSVEEVLTRYNNIKAHQKSWSDRYRNLRSNLPPAWLSRRVDSISKSEVADLLEKTHRRSKSVSLSLYHGLKAFFSWAEDLELLAASPMGKLKPLSTPSKRQHAIPDDTLASIWRFSVGEGFPFGAVYQLLILTAQRRSEVASMRWEDVDLLSKVWTIPPHLNKSHRVQIVPLVDTAVALISGLPRMGESKLVFPSSRYSSSNSVSGFSRFAKKAQKSVGAEDWTVHDFRRTVVTRMSQLGVNETVSDFLLNHSPRNLSGVASTYNVYKFQVEKRSALEAWERYLLENILINQT